MFHTCEASSGLQEQRPAHLRDHFVPARKQLGNLQLHHVRRLK